MQRHANIWRKLVAAIVVAAGVGVVWGVLAGWLITLGSTFFRGATVSEQINVALDGTPVIAVMSNDDGGMNTLNRRTLDGKPWPNDYEFWIHSTGLRRFELPSGMIQFPIPWSGYGERLAGGTDGKKPPTSWYVVSTDPLAERLYFAGFDPFSKLPVGYIGTAGFRLTVPPSEEQFYNPANAPGRASDRVASTQYLERYNLVRYHDVSTYDRPAQWLMFLLNNGKLWEVNLRERTARVVLEAPDSISVGMLSTLESIVTTGEPTPAASEKSAPTTDAPTSDAQLRLFDAAQTPSRLPVRLVQFDTFRASPTITGRLIPAAGGTDPPKYRSVVAIRTLDSVIMYDAVANREWKFKLPERIRPDTAFGLYWLNPETMLLDRHAGYWDNGNVEELVWFTADGKVQREENVKLQGWRPVPERQQIWPVAAILPEPIGWVGAVLGVVPFERLQNYKSDTYAAALQHTFAVAWPMIVIVLALAIAAAGVAVHWQRKYFRSHTAAWATFVFLFGVPGLVAYWLENRTAKLDACNECGQIVPRDRDACAACAAPFPAPPRIETEIFA